MTVKQALRSLDRIEALTLTEPVPGALVQDLRTHQVFVTLRLILEELE